MSEVQNKEKTVSRVVMHKCYNQTIEGVRVRHPVGTIIQVTLKQAEVFAERLQDPRVLKVQQAAIDASDAALAEIANAQQEEVEEEVEKEPAKTPASSTKETEKPAAKTNSDVSSLDGGTSTGNQVNTGTGAGAKANSESGAGVQVNK